ncbi:hypothetical protein GCM10009551_070690 [Nocardiopsis tropica]
MCGRTRRGIILLAIENEVEYWRITTAEAATAAAVYRSVGSISPILPDGPPTSTDGLSDPTDTVEACASPPGM